MDNSLFGKLFRDGDGNIVIAQPPNPPLIVWGIATLLKILFNSGQIYTGLDLVSFGCIFTWSWQELFQGVNYFRQGLGLIVLVGVLGSRIFAL